MSKRETILSTIASALAGTAQVSTNIFRSRVTAISKRDFPALVIEPMTDSADVSTIHRLTWSMLIQIAVLVRSDVADQAADPIVEDIHARMMGSATLDALVIDIRPVQVDWEFIDADAGFGAIKLQFAVQYQTASESIS